MMLRSTAGRAEKEIALALLKLLSTEKPEAPAVEGGLKRLCRATGRLHDEAEHFAPGAFDWLVEECALRFADRRGVLLAAANYWRSRGKYAAELQALLLANGLQRHVRIAARIGISQARLGEASAALETLRPLADAGVLDANALRVCAEAGSASGDVKSALQYLSTAFAMQRSARIAGALVRVSLAALKPSDGLPALAYLTTAADASLEDLVLAYEASLQSYDRDNDHGYACVLSTRLMLLDLNSTVLKTLARYALAAGRFEDAVQWLERLKPPRDVWRQRLETARVLSGVPEEYRSLRAGAALHHVLHQVDFATVLDVGSGAGEHMAAFERYGKLPTGVDYGRSVYARASHDGPNVLRGDYLTMTFEQPFDLVWASHVLEHQADTGAFLRKLKSDCRPGGVLAITVPPVKHAIVGGHLTLWNAGLLLYNLVVAGVNCRTAVILNYGYNISVIVRNDAAELPQLDHDAGDIERLSAFFPPECHEGFDGRMYHPDLAEKDKREPLPADTT